MSDRDNQKEGEFDSTHLHNGMTPEEWVAFKEKEQAKADLKRLEEEELAKAYRRAHSNPSVRPTDLEAIEGISYFLMWVGLWTAIGFAMIGSPNNAIHVAFYAAMMRLFALAVVRFLPPPR
jgi:hypothetical protein